MSTLSGLKSRVAEDLARTDLTSQIVNAVADAIYDYQERRFAFNQLREDFATVDGTEFYTSAELPDGIIKIDSIRAEVNGRRYQLEEWGYSKMERVASLATPTEGQPLAWAWYGEELRLYPVPDAAYTLTMSYHYRLDPPADDASNAWTDEVKAGQLIRLSAARRIAREYLKDDAEASRFEVGEVLQLKRLQRAGRLLETGGLVGSM